MTSLAPEPVRAVLRGIEVGEFIEKYWQKEHLILRGEAGRFAGLLPWRELNRILAEHALGGNQLRVVRAGQLVPPDQYRSTVEEVGGKPVSLVDGGRLAAELRRGAMVGLSQIDQLYPAIGRLAREFEYFFRDAVMVNAYIGFAGSKGFAAHWDDHEVFVLQVCGRKHWRVYGRTSSCPMYRELLEGERPPVTPVWEGEIEDGDLLYLPRGCWHDAEGADQPTIHLAFGVDCSIGVHLVSWLAKEVRASEVFRRDLPRFGSRSERREQARALREALLEQWDDDVIDRYFAAQDRAAASRAAVGLPAAVGLGEAVIGWLPPRPVELRIEALGRFIELEALGRSWMLPRASEPVVRALAERRRMRLSELRAAFQAEVPALDYYLDTWLAQGLIEWTTLEGEAGY